MIDAFVAEMESGSRTPVGFDCGRYSRSSSMCDDHEECQWQGEYCAPKGGWEKATECYERDEDECKAGNCIWPALLRS